MNEEIIQLLRNLLRAVRSSFYLHLLFTACAFVLFFPPYAQSDDGCAGVNFAKAPSDQYSPENLQRRLDRDPKDVDALINLGIHLEEVDQITEAYALYKRAIDAKPDCYLAYQFAGLVADRISRKTSAEADTDIHKALSLNPSTAKDGNVEAFLNRHAPLAVAPAKSAESAPKEDSSAWGGSRFVVGIGVGLLLSTAFIYLFRRRRPDHSVHA